MWTTIIILALALNLEPNRLGIIGLLLLRPNSIRQLLVFLCTSFAVSAAAGLTVLFVIHRGFLLKGQSGSAVVQIAVGALALVAAAVLLARRPNPAAAAARMDGTSSGSPFVDRITKRAGRIAHGSSTWLAVILGVGISLPSVDYIALLLLIATSGEPRTVQAAGLFTFLAVANAVLLIPIISYVVAKERTVRVLERVRSWVLARSHREYAVLLALVGVLLIGFGWHRLA